MRAIDRRTVRAFGVLSCLTAVTLAVVSTGTAVGAQAPSGGVSREFRYIMGTSVEVRVFNGDDAARKAAIDEAFAAIVEIDRLMSNYRNDSELAGINAHASAGPVKVSDPMFAVLQAAQQMSDRSGGAFDISVGPLVRLWGFHDKKPHLPTPAELAAVRPLVDARKIVLDASARTVRFTQPGIEIDLGGIAKGFAVELAAGVLRRRGLGGFIDAGGNQYMLGLPPGKPSWTVGVRDPDRPDALLGTLEVSGGSVSTSAGYATFLTIDGRRYGHILDPRTLRPSDASVSVTVVSEDGTVADAISTAAFILGPERGLALIQSFPGVSGLIAYRAADGHLAVTMTPDLQARFHRVAGS